MASKPALPDCIFSTGLRGEAVNGGQILPNQRDFPPSRRG